MSKYRDREGETQSTNGGDRPLADAQAHYDHDGLHDLTTTIIFTVADAEDVDPLEITSPPLYDYVDTVAVETALFGPARTRQNHTGTESLSFTYRGHDITVRSDGWISVRSTDG